MNREEERLFYQGIRRLISDCKCGDISKTRNAAIEQVQVITKRGEFTSEQMYLACVYIFKKFDY